MHIELKQRQVHFIIFLIFFYFYYLYIYFFGLKKGWQKFTSRTYTLIAQMYKIYHEFSFKIITICAI